MVVIGAVLWLLVSVAYLGALCTLAVIAFRSIRKRGSGALSSRVFLAVLAGALLGPPACAALYASWTFHPGGRLSWTKPRLVESFAFSYALAFGAAAGLTFVLLTLRVRRRKR